MPNKHFHRLPPLRRRTLLRGALGGGLGVALGLPTLEAMLNSHGTAYAQSWKNVAFQRMPNINLLPGDKPLSLDDLIAGTDDGILIKGRGSYSIDQQRYNFQFGGQTFHEIKGGKITGMLRDVAYQARTPDFWQACDAICGADEYEVGGSFYDGKGEPGQSNAVSHGCSPARFRQINVINTERSV